GVVRERAVRLGKRRGGKDNIRERGRLGLKQLLHDDQIELSQSFFAPAQVCGQETARDVERAQTLSRLIEQLRSAEFRVHQPDIVRADAVVVERERVEQEAPAFARAQELRQLREHRLRRRAQLAAERE